jgi:hypothetical protein
MSLGEFWYQIDSRIFSVLLVVAILVVAELGFRFGKELQRRGKVESDAGFFVVEGGILGLVGLILGFSFSLAVTRFDDRQHLIVDEANAIGTTYLRSTFLEPHERLRFQVLLHEYTVTKLNVYQHFADLAIRERSRKVIAGLQTHLWSIVSSAADRHPTLTLTILTQATNTMFDVGGALQASLSNHVPGAMVVLVIVASLAGAAVVGFGFGLSNTSHLTVSGLYALIMTVMVVVTLDLDRPARGYIRNNFAPLENQMQSIGQNSYLRFRTIRSAEQGRSSASPAIAYVPSNDFNESLNVTTSFAVRWLSRSVAVKIAPCMMPERYPRRP